MARELTCATKESPSVGALCSSQPELHIRSRDLSLRQPAHRWSASPRSHRPPLLTSGRPPVQATDLRVSIKGAAAARAEVRERRDGAVEVAYTAPMSGVYRIALAVGAASLGTFPAQCAPPRASEALSRVRLAAAGSAFVGERFAAAVEVLDQFGGRFAGDSKCEGPALAGALCCRDIP